MFAKIERELRSLVNGTPVHSAQKMQRAIIPKIQVSWGELIDRMTILEIKEQRLKSKSESKTSVMNWHRCRVLHGIFSRCRI